MDVAFDFTGRSVFITGGATGIGAGISAAFAKAGAQVFIGARRLGVIETFCARFPNRCHAIEMDVRLEEDRQRAIQLVVRDSGRLDVLVNNAMGQHRGSLEKQSLEGILDTYDTLLAGPTALIKLAVPHLEASKGCVVNVTSVAGRAIAFPPRGPATYNAAKAGLNHLTRSLAAEFGRRGVRVNAIAPGPTDTELKAFEDPEVRRRYEAETPLGRIGSADDVAGAALFLASNAASWITGQILDVSGGWGLTG